MLSDRRDFVTSQARYVEIYTEAYCVEKYGAAFLDYVYVMEKTEDFVGAGNVE